MRAITNDLKFSRESGNFRANNQNLEDQGAFIKFENQITLRRSNPETPLKIHFGYESDSSKLYQRDLMIDWSGIIELRNYLNTVIETQVPSNEFLYIHIDPFNSFSYSKLLGINYKGTVEMTGYDLVTLKDPNSDSPLFRIIRDDTSDSKYFFPLYTLTNDFYDTIEKGKSNTTNSFNPIYYLKQLRIESESNIRFAYYRGFHNYWELKEDNYDFKKKSEINKTLFKEQGLTKLEIEINIESLIRNSEKHIIH